MKNRIDFTRLSIQTYFVLQLASLGIQTEAVDNSVVFFSQKNTMETESRLHVLYFRKNLLISDVTLG